MALIRYVHPLSIDMNAWGLFFMSPIRLHEVVLKAEGQLGFYLTRATKINRLINAQSSIFYSPVTESLSILRLLLA